MAQISSKPNRSRLSKMLRAFQIAPLVVIVIVVGLGVFWSVGLRIPVAEFTSTPISRAEFYKRFGASRIPTLPNSADNVLYAESHVGIKGRMWLYRFDAPSADCIAFGKMLLEENGSAPDAELVPIKMDREPIGKEMLDRMGLGDVNWFDVGTIATGFEGQLAARSSPGAAFWIDTGRQRFYFYSAD